MPELPEVETVRRGLAKGLVGATIEKVLVTLAKQVKRPQGDIRAFSQGLCGRTVQGVDRRGKYLVFVLSGQHWLLAHLGMSGRLLLKPAGEAPAAHTHMILSFDNGLALHNQDVRQFGGLALWTEDPYAHPPLANLGPEPLSDAFTAEGLYQKSRGRKLAVKSFILDQKNIAGVGNIYADEALFIAGLRPRKAAGRLTRKDWQRLHQAIRQVLEEGIAAGGSSIRDYVGADGHTGGYQLTHRVYGRKGQACLVCGRPLKSIVVGGRSSVYCPHCQSS